MINNLRGPTALKLNVHTTTEQLMLDVLQLQTIYNDAYKAKPEEITIERITFEAIGTGIQQAYE
jgi:hypothetical protein